jgi:hypothetical protein
MSNLIVPPKIKNTAPKPNKTQLVEALLVKAKEIHDKENEQKKKIRENIENQLLEIGFKEIKKASKSKLKVQIQHYNNTAYIEFELNSVKCEELIERHVKAKYRNFYKNEAKKTIIESLKPANPLLNNSDVEKSLENLVQQIFNKVKTIEI